MSLATGQSQLIKVGVAKLQPGEIGRPPVYQNDQLLLKMAERLKQGWIAKDDLFKEAQGWSKAESGTPIRHTAFHALWQQVRHLRKKDRCR